VLLRLAYLGVTNAFALKEQRSGGDEAVRPELPGERWLLTKPHDPHADVEVSYQRMVGLRRRHPWLVDPIISTAEVANAHLVVQAEARRQPDRRLTLVLKITGDGAVCGSRYRTMRLRRRDTTGAPCRPPSTPDLNSQNTSRIYRSAGCGRTVRHCVQLSDGNRC
jgi:hypothetical protein